jgi:hypothetical protein
MKYNLSKISRNIPTERLYQILSHNSIDDLFSTITDCFYIRDYRNGRGERMLGRKCFTWMSLVYPNIFIKLIPLIPEYGRWDDLLYIENASVQKYIFDFIRSQLSQDYFNMTIGNKISLCAKWMPNEGKSFSRHHKKRFNHLLVALDKTPKQYRKTLSVMRVYISIVKPYSDNKPTVKNDKTKKSENYQRIINHLNITAY